MSSLEPAARFRARAIAVPFLLAVLAGWRPAAAANLGEYHIVPFLNLMERYDSNYYMSAEDVQSAFHRRISPGIQFARRTEILQAEASARLDWNAYSGDIDTDATDGGVTGSIGYSMTPRLRVSGSAAYVEDSQPDRDLRTTGIVIPMQSTQKLENYNLGVTYALTDRVNANLSGSYEKDRYEESSFSDSTTRTAVIGLDRDLYELFENVRGRVDLTATRYNFISSDQNYLEATVGANWQVDEAWSISGNAGLEFYRSGDSKPDWVFDVTSAYRGERFVGTLGIIHDRVLASGAGDTTQRTAAQATASWAFTETLSATLYAGAFRNTIEAAAPGAPAVREFTVEINPGVRWDLWKDLAISASYDYSRIRTEHYVNSTSERHQVTLQLNVRRDLLE